MEFVNRLLLWLGDTVLWLAASCGRWLSAAWGGLEPALNPVLSPVLARLNPICSAIGNAVYCVLSPLPAWLELVLLSAVTGMLMLVTFRHTSNQKAIGRARDDITANLLALKLFKDEPRLTLRSQFRVLAALARLQWHMLRPLVIMLLPMMLLLSQMGGRYQWRPLKPGERGFVRVRLRPAVTVEPEAVLETDTGAMVEVGPVPGGGDLVWRLRAEEPGRHQLRLKLNGLILEKDLVVGEGSYRVSAERLRADWAAQIMHPLEPLLPQDGPVESIVVQYPVSRLPLTGDSRWIWTFTLASLLSAGLLRSVVRVRV